METKKQTKSALFIFIGVMIGIIVTALGCFILYKNGVFTTEKKSVNSNQTQKNTTTEKKEETVTPKLLTFDATKCINNPGRSYTLAFYDNADGLSIRLDNAKKTATISINWQLFGPFSTASAWSGEVENYTVSNFTQTVEDVYIGGYGQSGGTQTALYLMNDGTVQYTPINDALTTAEGNNLKSFGSLSGVTEVVKFLTADSDGAVTVLAMKNDGTFYDLGKILADS